METPQLPHYKIWGVTYDHQDWRLCIGTSTPVIDSRGNGALTPMQKLGNLWHGLFHNKGPSTYDVHTEGGQAQVDACGRGEGCQSHVDVHTEN